MSMSPQFDVTSIGETMLRLSVSAGERLEMAGQMAAQPGGAESNVITLLARLGLRAAWCGALPDSALGRLAANHLRMAGVDLDGVAWRPDDRMGVYFVEFATPPRATQVIYDRTDSCAARLKTMDVAWTHLLNTHLLHLTGITPALSASSLEITVDALQRARAASIPVSFDVNFRAKLWSTAQAAHILTPLIEGVDLLFCSKGDAERLFALDAPPEAAIQQLAARTRARLTVMSTGDNGVLAWDGVTLHRQAAMPTVVLDRTGAGDALAAGVIYGWLHGDLTMGLRYGVTLAALALSQRGDIVITNRAEVENVLAGSGAISR